MDVFIYAAGLPSGYEIEHLARVFFPGALVQPGLAVYRAETLVYARAGSRRLTVGYRADGQVKVKTRRRLSGEENPKIGLSQMLYVLLKEVTGLHPPWGMLTGVRPVRLLRNKSRLLGEAEAEKFFTEFYDVDDAKYRMARQTVRMQEPILRRLQPRDFSLYIAIPFCPTRCSYCSFVSRSIEKEGGLIEPYLEKLGEELALTAAAVKELGLQLRSVYIGGGTPSVLTETQLDWLLGQVQRHFAVAGAEEYNLEAGRPDCTTYEKLRIMKNYGVTRVSVNPQSMSQKVLSAIGRKHGPEDILRCMDDARRADIRFVNMDLIAGLPEDTPEGFQASLRQIMNLQPENLTVHTLTLKRGSRLVAEGAGGGRSAGEMLEQAYPALWEGGYSPYYMYRQKNTPANLENTGWAKAGCEGLYNIYIMEEVQTILSVGAGAVTKLVGGEENRIKRLFNDKYPLEYLRNFDKVIRRKNEMRDTYASILDSEEAR